VFTARYLLDLYVCFKVHLIFKVFIPTQYGAIPAAVFFYFNINVTKSRTLADLCVCYVADLTRFIML